MANALLHDCSKCKERKPLPEFPPSKARNRRQWCRACLREDKCGAQTQRVCDGCGETVTVTERRAAERYVYCSRQCKSIGRRYTLYGISREMFEEMLRRQDGGCAICETPVADVLARRLHVDHDHATGAVRGLLCAPCNSGLGHFRDNPASLGAAIAYLQGDSNG